jgi:molybdopterin adenylyltransferase
MKIISINISKKKGTIKIPVNKAVINNKGIVDDAHSGDWHRQISMLSSESIDKFSKQANRKISYGEFAENITTEGIDLSKISLLDHFKIGKVKLEVTQIGKSCHGSNCAIYKEIGNCVMPKEGIFCRVISGGKIKKGDQIAYLPKSIKFKIITLSDRASIGEYEDKSGPKIKELIENFFQNRNRKFKILSSIIPDNSEQLRKQILKAKKNKIDCIITTGGTGIGKRDITPDVVKTMLDKEIPGIMDFIRMKYGTEKPNALLSRSIAGIIDDTLIYVLPGSTKAVEEYMDEILKTMEHLLYMIKGLDIH